MQTLLLKPMVALVCAGLSLGASGVLVPKLHATSYPRKETVLESTWQKAKKALEAGDTKAATRHASRMLRENTQRKAWFYGNVVHEGNQILGLAALRERRLPEAKRCLVAAGKTPGSPQLDSFGPHMVLAQQLLDRGEKKAVIQYLTLVSKFWGNTSEQEIKRMEKSSSGLGAEVRKSDRATRRRISIWKAQILVGHKPRLNYSSSLL